MPEDRLRVEFGAVRTRCDCAYCIVNCRFIPGYLIPSDLGRLIPPEVNTEVWAREHLLASSGAKILRVYAGGRREVIQVRTLVPATKRHDLACHWLKDDRCSVHTNSPFGCAFFTCTQTKEQADALSSQGLAAIMEDARTNGLYSQLWTLLRSEGLNALDAAIKRKVMADYIEEHEYRLRRSR